MQSRRAAAAAALILIAAQAAAQPTPNLTLTAMVEPSSRFVNDRGVVTFALEGFIEFERLVDLFDHIDRQAGRWRFASPAERDAFAHRLLRKGVESRLISMVYDAPRELLLTHTAGQLAAAADAVRTPADPDIYAGAHWRLTRGRYRDTLLQIQSRWKRALNCWSAAPSVPARVLSNWYVIAEGIELYGASYDSTEHFWQAVKYHPEVSVGDLLDLLARFERIDWTRWVGALERDQDVYFAHTYAVEFLRANFGRLRWFAETLRTRVPNPGDRARALQQRQGGTLRFTPLDEKILWGDLADVFHLVYFFTTGLDGRFRTPDLEPVVAALAARRFDGVYVGGPGPARVGFISPEFQLLMFEIWKVKFLQMTRFGDVIRSIDPALRLDHFLNDGDSPDIPIPVYVRYLNETRDLARRQAAAQR